MFFLLKYEAKKFDARTNPNRIKKNKIGEIENEEDDDEYISDSGIQSEECIETAIAVLLKVR